MKRFALWSVGLLAASILMAPANAELRTTYANVGTVVPGSGPAGYSGLNVNRNPGSPYYGYVYAAERLEILKIKIYKPVILSDGSGATSYEDTGLRIVPSTAGATNPWDVFVGPDDTVWIMNLGAKVIDSAPPVPTTGTEVTATKQIDVAAVTTAAGVAIGASGPRGIAVTGPVDNAKVYLTLTGGGGGFYQRFSVTGGTQTTAGTATLDWSAVGGNLTYGVAVDPAGNSYWPESATPTSATVLKKLNADGTVDAAFLAPYPAFFTANLAVADADFVADADAPGGGYILTVHRTRTGTASVANPDKVSGHRWALDGTWLSGWGPAMTGAPGNYTTIDLVAAAASNTTGATGSAQYFGADDKGNFYPNFKDAFPGGNGAFTKVAERAPFVVDASAATSAAAPVKSSPTAVDGVVYFGADDGKLYAYTTADGNPVAGFPVDINAAVGATVQLLGRPSVYFGSSEKGIYLTTNRGDVVKVMPDGTLVWVNTSFAGTSTNTATTPAVTSDGMVFSAINGVNGVQVVKLSDTTGALLDQSPVLAPATGSVSSPAVELDGAKVYVGTQGGTTGDLWLINGASMAVLTSFASGEGVVAPPHVKGIDTYVGTLAGNLYKVNSATMTEDPAFGTLNGTPGRAAIGEALVTDAFPNTGSTLPGGVFYVGSNAGKVWGVNAVDGAYTLFYNTGDTAVVGGLVINRGTDVLAFGTSAGKFYQVPLLAPALAQVFPGYGALSSTPTVDRSTGSYLVGSEDSNVYSFGELVVAIPQ